VPFAEVRKKIITSSSKELRVYLPPITDNNNPLGGGAGLTD